LGCLMHVRRRFHSAFVGGHLGAAVPIRLIKGIYKVETEAKEQNLSPEQRRILRTERSLPLLWQFDEWVDAHLPNLLPKSPLGSAASYARDQRPYIHRCFTDGAFELDTGRVEREIKEPAIGRKNYLFSGSADGARRLAAAYTVVQSARHAGLDTRTYLIDVLGKLANGWKTRRIGELIPTRWKPGL